MSGMVAQAAPDFKCLNKNCLSKYIYIYICHLMSSAEIKHLMTYLNKK